MFEFDPFASVTLATIAARYDPSECPPLPPIEPWDPYPTDSYA